VWATLIPILNTLIKVKNWKSKFNDSRTLLGNLYFLIFLFVFLWKDHITAHDLETDPALGLHEEQPDSWTPTVTKEVIKHLVELFSIVIFMNLP